MTCFEVSLQYFRLNRLTFEPKMIIWGDWGYVGCVCCSAVLVSEWRDDDDVFFHRRDSPHTIIPALIWRRFTITALNSSSSSRPRRDRWDTSVMMFTRVRGIHYGWDAQVLAVMNCRRSVTHLHLYWAWCVCIVGRGLPSAGQHQTGIYSGPSGRAQISDDQNALAPHATVPHRPREDPAALPSAQHGQGMNTSRCSGTKHILCSVDNKTHWFKTALFK